jgi:tetratricopeptide (TPR) repeat protein
MKKSKRLAKANPEVAAAPARSAFWTWWPWAAGFAALLAALEIYGPALHGPFVLDDRTLPYMNPSVEGAPLSAWLGVRPLLMLSFWLNYQNGGLEPFGYHLVNVFLHFLTSVVVSMIAARLLTWAGVEGRKRDVLAVLAGALFLVHPMQTESVAYVASRSENLSVLLFYSGLAVFLYRGEESMSWLRAVIAVALFGAAVMTKEHTAVFPAVVLLTDYFWNRGGLRKNAFFYALVAVGGAAAAVLVVRVLTNTATAGLNTGSFTPFTYFYTQCRVVWSYVRLFFLPFGQNADPDVDISQTITQHGAIFGLLAIVAALAAAFVYRKRWPLAAYGTLLFFVLVAPTSSFVPILDPAAERRLYLPMLGLILIVLEVLRHVKLSHAIAMGAAACVILGALAYQRSELWGDPLLLWSDTAAKSPHKLRPRFQLAFAYYDAGRCAEAATNYEAASKLAPPRFDLLMDWALSLDCAGKEDDALRVLRQATAYGNGAHVHATLGMVYAKTGRNEEALKELSVAETLDPQFEMTYVYRGGIDELAGDRAGAVREYQHALAINPQNSVAREALARVAR